jgi:chromosome segregation ATPase
VKASEIVAAARLIVPAVADRLKALLAQRDAKLDELETRLAKAHETIASLERRASRHGDHLGRLETRVRSIETGGRP